MAIVAGRFALELEEWRQLRRMEAEMTKKEEPQGLRRRGFLGAFAGVASAATVVAVGPQVVSEAHAQESDDEKRKARYEETDHVKDFYRTNRY